MRKYPTEIIFLWHMHQPLYKSPYKDYYCLPWVRLHAVKDYYGMAKMVERFDKLKVSFNFSGVLLEQIFDYVYNQARDYYQILTLKDPYYLNEKEREFIIDRFFSVNLERFIMSIPRYAQLYEKKSSEKKKFTPQEIMDLQILFNICWFHPYSFREDKNLREILTKERNFSCEDKKYIINKQMAIMKKVIPLYKKLSSQGKIELSVSPYHHPILPLIYDTEILKEFPHLKKPSRFSAPSHCRWHLRKAREMFKKVFSHTPQGSWPSEGGISERIVSLYQSEKFKWIGTDEEILFKSLAGDYTPYEVIKKDRHIIYRPYKFDKVNILFRDRNLSDAISFIYQGWDNSCLAAQDLLGHFKRIHYSFEGQKTITIIMDGENAWEYYYNNGVDFLETVYSGLEKNKIFTSSLPKEIIKKSKPAKLQRLASGSWINADWGVWIGSRRNNRYWNILKTLKNLISSSSFLKRKKAWDFFYIIEGSDWFWWNTFDDPTGEFKRLFLSFVNRIHKILGKKSFKYK